LDVGAQRWVARTFRTATQAGEHACVEVPASTAFSALLFAYFRCGSCFCVAWPRFHSTLAGTLDHSLLPLCFRKRTAPSGVLRTNVTTQIVDSVWERAFGCIHNVRFVILPPQRTVCDVLWDVAGGAFGRVPSTPRRPCSLTRCRGVETVAGQEATYKRRQLLTYRFTTLPAAVYLDVWCYRHLLLCSFCAYRRMCHVGTATFLFAVCVAWFVPCRMPACHFCPSSLRDAVRPHGRLRFLCGRYLHRLLHPFGTWRGIERRSVRAATFLPATRV